MQLFVSGKIAQALYCNIPTPFTHIFPLLFPNHLQPLKNPSLTHFHLSHKPTPSRKHAKLEPSRRPNPRNLARAKRHPILWAIPPMESHHHRPHNPQRKPKAEAHNPPTGIPPPPPRQHGRLHAPLPEHNGESRLDTRHAHAARLHTSRNGSAALARRQPQ